MLIIKNSIILLITNNYDRYILCKLNEIQQSKIWKKTIPIQIHAMKISQKL
jgi:hypothetical protein